MYFIVIIVIYRLHTMMRHLVCWLAISSAGDKTIFLLCLHRGLMGLTVPGGWLQKPVSPNCWYTHLSCSQRFVIEFWSVGRIQIGCLLGFSKKSYIDWLKKQLWKYQVWSGSIYFYLLVSVYLPIGTFFKWDYSNSGIYKYTFGRFPFQVDKII